MQCDDIALIRNCLKGNTDTYELLVDKYKEMIYTMAYRMTGDSEAADDIAQESFISAYGALKEFKGNSKFSTWLCSIALNKCRDHLKSLKPYVPLDDIEETAHCCSGITPEHELVGKQLMNELQSALNALPEEYREAIVLKHIEGLDYKEMELLLNVRADTLKVRTHRAREMMKNLMRKGNTHD